MDARPSARADRKTEVWCTFGYISLNGCPAERAGGRVNG